jgi:hypothetical protein
MLTPSIHGRTGWESACRNHGVNVQTPELNFAAGSGIPSINQALDAYFRDRQRRGVDDAIRRARKKYTAMPTGVQNLLVWLFDQLETQHPPAAKPVPPAAQQLLGQEIIAKLQAMRLYACTDAPAFRDKIVDGLQSQVENRMWRAGFDPQRVDRANSMGNSVPYKQATLRMVCELVVQARSAVCTTFAMSAGHILSGGKRAPEPPAYRVEVVAAPDHCYALVNRAGGEVEHTGARYVLPSSQWGPDVIIVDPWAGSLGHPIFYAGPGAYPAQLRCYLDTDLKQNYDSTKPDPVVNSVAQSSSGGARFNLGGVVLRKTGVTLK